ncbi:hypothetical protein TanjilG_00396 [Lupinus angustifolius]|uniref:Uncharacterized protein n=1 Tax=Lupinus angustifolius TaxID=3871 RepID=A0A1J7HVM3_LUPAN|nr:PREDICTED: uncharacterized protein LOC109349280 isoform X1 [Lupinus angustifolius]XP_019445566.1 PREDICTED: uncharacterized protein LOC109349280 isoform X2 [Lupinus angustifolius]OIW10458.1 hypothetical protein TanjilG_00396 [Lupinus angustifolius]
MASLFAAQLEPYWCRVSRLYQPLLNVNDKYKKRPTLNLTEGFIFYTKVLSRTIDSNSHAKLTTLLHYSEDIGCKSFFQEEGLDFLHSHISHPNLPSKLREEIVKEAIYKVRQMFEFDDNFGSDHGYGVEELSDSRPLQYCLVLEIVVDTREDVNN